MKKYVFPLMVMFAICGCKPATDKRSSLSDEIELSPMQRKLQNYYPVKLTADLSHLSVNEQKMIPILIEISNIMDEIFWMQAYGNRDSLLNTVNDQDTREYIMINYGPWDRIDNNRPFVPGISEKPAGANFYPAGMTREEFENADLPNKNSLYTLLRRDDSGNLIIIWYHEAYAVLHERAADLLGEAALLADDEGLKTYLNARAEALLNSNYLASDMAWMDMKDNNIDFVVGPIETYEDKLFGYKAAHEAYILIKDQEWSQRLSRYAQFLPELQRGLPVPPEYKSEIPGTESDLNAYDVIYYAGDCNAGTKTIAINLPNDERVQQQKGSRRLQLKNAMRAKYDHILLPISNVLIAQDQRRHITFDAFFGNTMFHEVAHGLGIKYVLGSGGKIEVQKALMDKASALEEGKADILGLYMINYLHEKGEISGELMDYYVTFLAGIFRSVRFGAASAHGQANMIRFNFFEEMGAFSRDEVSGTYRVHEEEMRKAVDALSEKILRLQGDGDYEALVAFMEETAKVKPRLQSDLDRLEYANIPVDIVFEQGIEVLGLKVE